MHHNKEAFLEMLEEDKGIIFKICHSYCSDPESQKDLVQEVILQLWNSFDRFDGRSKRSTWVYRVALNVAISNYRKLKTKKKYLTPLDNDLVIIDNTENEAEEDVRLLRQFIDQLDGINKALMILYLEEKSYEEIGKILSITSSNVGTKINRIKRKLKEQFKTIEQQ